MVSTQSPDGWISSLKLFTKRETEEMIFSESDGAEFSRQKVYKSIFLSLSKLNFWLKREEIKHFLSKILSYSWSPCILNSIGITLRQDWSPIIARIDRNHPLNVERMSKKKPDQYSSINAIWSPIFASIELVVWFLHNPCNLCRFEYNLDR